MAYQFPLSLWRALTILYCYVPCVFFFIHKDVLSLHSLFTHVRSIITQTHGDYFRFLYRLSMHLSNMYLISISLISFTLSDHYLWSLFAFLSINIIWYIMEFCPLITAKLNLKRLAILTRISTILLQRHLFIYFLDILNYVLFCIFMTDSKDLKYFWNQSVKNKK